MRYKTKVTVMTGGKEYRPGDILPADISNDDLDFLRSKGFIEPADIATVATETMDETDDFPGFDEREPDALKSSAEIRKIRSKKELVKYAQTIGFRIGEDFEEKNLKNLQEEVINFQEEKLAEQDRGKE